MGEEKQQKEEKEEKKKPSSGSGLTISTTDGTNTGATISTYDGGETGAKEKSNIYQDPNTGSTIATKEARTNVAEGGDYQIVASTSTPKTTDNPKGLMESNVIAGQTIKTKPLVDDTSLNEGQYTPKVDPVAEKQKELISEPRPSKDLATGKDLKYSGPESTTSINKASPALRRALLGTGSGSVLRRLFGL